MGSFTAIDSNRDGYISREEFTEAMQRLFNISLVPFVVDTVFAWV